MDAEEKQLAEDTAKREKLRAETKKEGTGDSQVALYRVGPQGAYCQGVTYSQGQIIRRPVKFLPSLTWTAVVDESPGAPAKPPPAPAKMRASDRE